MADQGIGCGGGWRGWDVEFGPGSGNVEGVWECCGNIGEMSVRCRWNVGEMSCTEKGRNRGYDGDVNRSKVQEIRGLEGVGGVGTRA